MKLKLALLLSLLAAPAYLLAPMDANAQGVVPAALSSNVDQNGRPIAGGLLYVYANATTTPQTCYQDLGLTVPMTNPIVADRAGRIPLFYCAAGQVHLRFTTAAGDVVYDYPTVLVSGSAGGGGGGGGGVDPSTVLSTGDIKFRQTAETLTGWVKLNGTTIGSAASGASQRANADTQALFNYLWAQCPQAHCAVSGGRGSTAVADFSANKTMAVPDWRDRTPLGLDDMGTSAKGGVGGLPPIASGGTDSATTPGAWGGGFNVTLAQANLPAVPPSGTVTVTAEPTVFGTITPTGTVGIGGSLTTPGSVSITGTLTPSGTIGGSVSPTITMGGSQTINVLTNSGFAYTGPASAPGNFNNVTIFGSSFTANTTISGSSFTFTGTPVAASTQVGATFNAGTINGTSFTGTFTGNSILAHDAIGLTGGSYSFTGTNLGSGASFATTDPFILGTWYMKLAAPADLHICDMLSCKRQDGEDI